MAIKLLIGGSPCTHWSIAQKNNRETEPSGMGWELFKNYLVAKEKFKPDFFLYENNKSAAQPIKDQIAQELGVGSDPQARFTYINSALVSAQNRQRFYVTNFGDIEQPTDRGISFEAIKDTDYEYSKQFVVKRTPSRERMWNNGVNRNANHSCPNITHSEKSATITTKQDRSNNAGLIEFEGFCRYLTTHELEKLQTLPVGYTKSVSRTQAEKAIGNGWTAEVIIHLLNHALKDVPKDEEIVVLSLYDGIGTGRYCLDKMGFTNVKYHAYEIDKYPMAIANDNYPDIVQHGDAFAVREDSWKPPQTRSEWLDDLLGGVRIESCGLRCRMLCP
jgi:site-specific DNA-cytosine methylase